MKKILPKVLIIGIIVAVVGGILYFIFGNDDWGWLSFFVKREICFEGKRFLSFVAQNNKNRFAYGKTVFLFNLKFEKKILFVQL